jgi:hypothetical protein
MATFESKPDEFLREVRDALDCSDLHRLAGLA